MLLEDSLLSLMFTETSSTLYCVLYRRGGIAEYGWFMIFLAANERGGSG